MIWLIDENTIKFENIGSSNTRPSDFEHDALMLTPQ